MLSPILLVGDRLSEHEDAAIRRSGEILVRAVNRITDRLEQAREEVDDRSRRR